MHNYYFSQIITTLVPVGKARETKVSYVEINCRRRRKILHIFGPSVLLAWRNHQQFPRSFSIRSGPERKKLAAYFFLRGQQFSAEPPPPPPLGTQVPPKRDRKEIDLSDVLCFQCQKTKASFRKSTKHLGVFTEITNFLQKLHVDPFWLGWSLTSEHGERASLGIARRQSHSDRSRERLLSRLRRSAKG